MKLLLLPALLAIAAPAVAQDSPTPPAGTLADMAWLVGQWEGTGIGGQRAIESWLPAFGSTMVGTFVQADAAGEVMFSEHMVLAEEAGSLVLKIKHFNADLTGWEEAAEMERFALVSLEPCRTEFTGLTMTCHEGGLRISVRARADDGSVATLDFDFRKVD